MDYIIIEINNHKKNIENLSTKLNNIFNIDEEISINNEIKKEIEILSSLLNEKKNMISQNNNINYNSQMHNLNNINQNPFQQQMMQQQMKMQQQMIEQKKYTTRVDVTTNDERADGATTDDK